MTADYLIIEPFLENALPARALHAAFDLGVIDVLEERMVVSQAQLFRNRSCDTDGGQFLIQMLSHAGICSVTDGHVRLTDQFRAALQYRDLLVTKLQFADLVAPDFFAKLPQLLNSAEEFMGASRIFELFDYSRCRDITPQNCLQASRWMKLTTILTRYEAPVCHQYFPFAEHRNMLDLGGNSGEFALQICRREPALQATVADLPVVCHVGSRHIAGTPEAARISFQPLHFIEDRLPDAFDLVTCKSVLHDWPDDHAELIVRRVYDALPEGGRFMIFERRKWNLDLIPISYGLLPVLLFFRSYRIPEFYIQLLKTTGFREVSVETIPLEVPFILVTGRK